MNYDHGYFAQLSSQMSKLFVAMGDEGHPDVKFDVISEECPSRRTGSINAFDDGNIINDDGEDDNDDDPLLNMLEDQTESLNRPEMLRIYKRDAERLMGSLEDATLILQTQLDKIYTERQILKERLSPPSRRCKKLRDRFSRLFKKFTGAKVMAATILLQLLCLVILTLVDNLPRGDEAKRDALQTGSIFMIILQTANLIVIIIISGQLVAQVQARHVSGTLLMQAYLATILLFAGIYTATYRMSPTSWKFVEENVDSKNPDMVVTTYTRFLFYSVSTATLCGGADALPKEWYTCIFSSVQMLLSFMYFTSVIGKTIRNRVKPSKKRLPLTEELNTLAKYNSSIEHAGRQKRGNR